MLSIIFGYSKYYVDSLSENVKRGNRAKVSQGWRPNMAPLGYRNCKETRTIVRDPDRFPLVRRMFELMLAGTHSPRDIYILARDDWCLRTPQRSRSGGRRSDERRAGKECDRTCRSRWSTSHYRKYEAYTRAATNDKK